MIDYTRPAVSTLLVRGPEDEGPATSGVRRRSGDRSRSNRGDRRRRDEAVVDLEDDRLEVDAEAVIAADVLDGFLGYVRDRGTIVRVNG